MSDLTTTGYTAFTNAAYNTLPTPVLTLAQFPTIFGFDEARTASPAYPAFGYYSPATTASTLTPGRGWSVLMSGQKTPDLVGALTTGDVPMTLTVTGPNASPNTLKAGWHLLGCPYAQPIDWEATVPAALSGSISVYRTQGGNSGQYLTRANGTGSLPDGVVPVGQAFFARALSATTFTFTNALRVEANPTTVARPAATANAADPRAQAVLTLNQVGTPEQDEVYIYFEDGATAGLDHRYDGQRPGPNTGAVPTLSALTSTGEEVAVNGLPETALTTATPVELALTLPAPGTRALAAAELRHLTGAPVTLLDRFTGTAYDLHTTPKVTFTAEAGDVRGRFALILGQRLLGIHSSFSTPTSALTLYPNPATGQTREAPLAIRRDAGMPALLSNLPQRRKDAEKRRAESAILLDSCVCPDPASHRSVVQIAGARPAERLLVTDLTGRAVLVLMADATGAVTLPSVALTKGVYVVRGGASVQRLVVE